MMIRFTHSKTWHPLLAAFAFCLLPGSFASGQFVNGQAILGVGASGATMVGIVVKDVAVEPEAKEKNAKEEAERAKVAAKKKKDEVKEGAAFQAIMRVIEAFVPIPIPAAFKGEAVDDVVDKWAAPPLKLQPLPAKKPKNPASYTVIEYVNGKAQPPRKVTMGFGQEKLEGVQELVRIEARFNAQAKQMLQQLKPQFEQIKNGEMRFVHLVCPLKESQFKAIQKDVVVASRTALIQTVQARYQRNAGRRPPAPDVQQMIENALLKAVERELSADQFAIYAKELIARKSFRREAGVEMLVASLDRDLMLTPKQRQDMIEPIRQAWQHSWQINIQMLSNGNRYLPRLPSTEIRKMLSKNQKTIFSSIAQGTTVYSSNQFPVVFGIANRNTVSSPLEDELDFLPEEE